MCTHGPQGLLVAPMLGKPRTHAEADEGESPLGTTSVYDVSIALDAAGGTVVGSPGDDAGGDDDGETPQPPEVTETVQAALSPPPSLRDFR